MRIALDVGHGGVDPGVVDGATGLPEKTANWWVALTLKHLLAKDGHVVILTRSGDVNPGFPERLRTPGDVLISVHHDWVEGRALVYHARNERSEALGMVITKALGVPLWPTSRSRFGGLWIDDFRGPALLWEVSRLADFEPSVAWRIERCAAFVAGLRAAW